MRFFLDANILVSAIGWPGTERRLLAAFRGRTDCSICSSPIVLEETLSALVEEKIMGFSLAREAVDQIRRFSYVEEPLRLPPHPNLPAEDVHVTNALVALVTGDRKLLHLKEIYGAAVIRTADALRILGVPVRSRKHI